MNPPSPHPLPGLVIETTEAPAAKRRQAGTLITPSGVKSGGLLAGIAKGLACSAAVTVIFNFLYIKNAVLYACSLVVAVGGEDPEITKIKKKLVDGIDKLEKPDAEPFKTGHIPKLPSPASIVTTPIREAGNDIKKGAAAVGDKLETKAGEIGDKLTGMRSEHAEAEREKLLVRARMVGITPADDWSLAKLKTEVTLAEAAKAERSSLMVRAVAVGLTVDEAWSTDKLKTEVMQAETLRRKQMAEQGPNGRCVKCSTPMRVSRAGNGWTGCPRCGNRAKAGAVRAMNVRTFGRF